MQSERTLRASGVRLLTSWRVRGGRYHRRANCSMMTFADGLRVSCPECRSRLVVNETPGGGRSVCVAHLGLKVEDSAKGLERTMPPGEAPDLICPACAHRFHPAAPYRGPRWRA
jgi:DNA-directed RNA polymerase subunit RPC12/RpoP